MTEFPGVFRRFVPQLLYVIVLPIFFLTFMLVYRPFGISDFLGPEWFGVHLTIISCIVLMSAVISRLLYFFLPLKMNYGLYMFWCLSEILFASFFVALYIWLVRDKPMLYFEILMTSFKFLFFTLVIPYIVLSLALVIHEYHTKTGLSADAAIQRMRFYDNLHNLKIVLVPQAVLYISADENYVTIFYLENGKVREYVLRSSMKSLEELCQDNGLVRCHRSFYINPAHIKVLRKDRDGIMYAELDADDVRHIPVSKTYYGRLSDIL